MTDELPVAVEQAIADGVDPEDISEHLSDVGDHISDMTDETRAGNLIYAQQHVLQRAVDLLRELYDEQDELDDRAAEMMAVAIILDKETENEVW